jgi:hypothetical protein
MWLRIALAGHSFHAVDDCLAIWHVHEFNLSHHRDRQLARLYASLKSLQRGHPDLATELSERRRMVRRQRWYWCLEALKQRPTIGAWARTAALTRRPGEARALAQATVARATRRAS